MDAEYNRRPLSTAGVGLSSREARASPLFLPLLLLASFTLKLWILSVRSENLGWYDESLYLLLARSLSEGRGYVLNGLPNIAFPPLLPVIVAVLGRLFRDPIFAIHFQAAFFGALAVLPAHGLFRRIAGARPAAWAALVLAFLPALNDFFGFGRAYGEITYDGTEPLYVFLAALAAYFALLASLAPSLFHSLLAGLALGTLFLARSQGLFFLLVFLAHARLAHALLLGRRFLLVTLKGAVAMGLAFLAVSAPYLFYLHQVTGKFILSGQQGAVLDVERGMREVVRSENWWNYMRHHYALDSTGDHLHSSYWGFDPGADPREPDRIPPLGASPHPSERTRLTIVLDNLLTFLSFLGRRMVTPTLALPVLAGLLARRPNGAGGARERIVGEILLLGFFPPVLVFALPFWVLLRHMIPLAIPIAYSAGLGLNAIESFLRRRLPEGALPGGRFDRSIGPVLAAGIFFGLTSTIVRPVLFPTPKALAQMAEAEERKAIAESVREILPRGSPLMSWHPSVAVLAGMDWRTMPLTNSVCELASYAVARGIPNILFSGQHVVFGDLRMDALWGPGGGGGRALVTMGNLGHGEEILVPARIEYYEIERRGRLRVLTPWFHPAASPPVGTPPLRLTSPLWPEVKGGPARKAKTLCDQGRGKRVTVQ